MNNRLMFKLSQDEERKWKEFSRLEVENLTILQTNSNERNHSKRNNHNSNYKNKGSSVNQIYEAKVDSTDPFGLFKIPRNQELHWAEGWDTT